MTVRTKNVDHTRIYETQQWGLIHQWKLSGVSFASENNFLVKTVGRSKSGTSSDRNECGFQFYNINTGNLVSEWFLRTEDSENACPRLPLIFLPGRTNRVLTLDIVRTAVVEWDTNSHKLVRRFQSKVTNLGPPPGPASWSVSVDGKFFAVVWWRTDGPREFGTSIWDLQTGKVAFAAPVSERNDQIQRVCFSPNGEHLALVHQDRVEVYEFRAN